MGIMLHTAVLSRPSLVRALNFGMANPDRAPWLIVEAGHGRASEEQVGAAVEGKCYLAVFDLGLGGALELLPRKQEESLTRNVKAGYLVAGRLGGCPVEAAYEFAITQQGGPNQPQVIEFGEEWLSHRFVCGGFAQQLAGNLEMGLGSG
jgi:hypothetical protein